ncbi:hypothetical protein V6N11_068143 [Hibiscus sabdariffa]|uniref:Reverse transcriptase zinc-binding domain-containing protein n=1 Tax=Hibiscus sabdariffa TaxID=183260 RepID=A0ABR2SST7_9ROSI
MLFLGQASIAWHPSATGNFSVSSAYSIRVGQLDGAVTRVWRLIRPYRGLPKIRLFMWLACRNRLMTNAERVRRHSTLDGNCYFCHDHCEDVDHILRRCPQAVATWQCIIKPSMLQAFMSDDTLT